MTAAIDSGHHDGRAARLGWLPVGAGLLFLYAPVFYGLSKWYWQTEEGGHGPIILAVIVWLVWKKRAMLFDAPAQRAPFWGFALLLPGLLVYTVGRSVEIALLEIGAMMPILAGVLLAMRGWPVLRALWFPIFFIVFMLPLPGIFVDALTGPLKQVISDIAERLLYAAGYPVARTGVVLMIGQYQLLVADACSGLNSMFSLSALGILFMYQTARTSVIHNAVMLASILPIAFVANIVRVVLLMLITYHFGDAAGQGFLHGATGVVLLMVALSSLFVLDTLLSKVIRPRKRA